jgi:ribosomal protein L37E
MWYNGKQMLRRGDFMVCNNCGRQVHNEEANFCEYCGNSFREHIQNSTYEQVNPYEQAQARTPFNPLLPNQAAPVRMSEGGRPISFLNWLGSYGIFFIPVIGTLLFPIMLLVWSFSSNVSQTKKNWARATLIFVIILFINMAMIMGYLLTDPAVREYINGNISYNELMRQLAGLSQ